MLQQTTKPPEVTTQPPLVTQLQTSEVQVVDWTRAEQLLDRWNRRAKLAQDSHYISAGKRGVAYKSVGFAAAIFTALTGVSAFGSLLEGIGIWGKIATVACSIIAGILTGIQVFFQFGDSAQKHHVAAAKYGGARKLIESISVTPIALRGTMPACLKEVRDLLTTLASESPHTVLSDADVKRMKAEYDQLFPERHGNNPAESG